ncbi:EamA family transporter RarD [Phascolarctobacterium sp. Marseille-Q4147]|uniref:EamA family transporter RarD n=1 Tax=Phascolarctobacterium sp. Marseille-Q4147 TaxID=2823317 RepID=UPI001B31B90E|nr:EamA family transporter RarD [Phascolarctobacterium sp. Marseille-Q4147]QTV78556.1 EamA family transporter RarD [Phascolarctobacterium sp. Marseille-Q4147]
MDNNYRLGIFYGLGAYLLWGVLPIYWKLLQHVEAMEILASRFLWSAVFVFLLLLATGKLNIFMQETKVIFSTKKTACCMVLAAIMISFNWGIFIWAVEAGRIVETSMGYYISPLMNVLFGVVFLRERLAKLQIAAVSCAAVGIGVIIVHNGGLPWVALTLPLTFAFYGLLKKIIVAQPMTSILLETLLISPLAAGYLYYLSINEGTVYQSCDMSTLLLLAGAGAVTATPMLLFTACARKLPLNIVGFLQYISPSISLMIGVLIYGEPFTGTTATAFGCIWAGLALFIWSQIRR